MQDLTQLLQWYGVVIMMLVEMTVKMMMMILMNVWVGMYAENREDFLVKVDYYQEFCEKMGIPVIDDRIKEAFICYFDEVIKEQPGWA